MTTAYIGLGSNLGNRKGHINSAIKLLADSEHIELTRVSDIIETSPLVPLLASGLLPRLARRPASRRETRGQASRDAEASKRQGDKTQRFDSPELTVEGMEQSPTLHSYGDGAPKYLNAVAEIKTNLAAEDLHKNLIEIETSLGRVRKEKWASRIIDLDLLLFGENVINHTDLSDESDLTVPHPQMHLRSFVLKGLCQLNPNLLHPIIKEPIGELAARLNGYDFVLDQDVPQLVSIAGIIGVGKTTLTKKLSNLFGCKLILEPYDKNPFLPDVYAGKKELALDSQLFFLNSRIEQLNHNELARGQLAIIDYVFNKELIYAKRLLNPKQLAEYKKIYPPFAEKVVKPVLVIYLQDTPENCIHRIHKRNRPYEQKIELQFLQELDSDYQQLFADWKTCPVIRLSVSNFDCTKPADINRLANQIKHYTACPA